MQSFATSPTHSAVYPRALSSAATAYAIVDLPEPGPPNTFTCTDPVAVLPPGALIAAFLFCFESGISVPCRFSPPERRPDVGEGSRLGTVPLSHLSTPMCSARPCLSPFFLNV